MLRVRMRRIFSSIARDGCAEAEGVQRSSHGRVMSVRSRSWSFDLSHCRDEAVGIKPSFLGSTSLALTMAPTWACTGYIISNVVQPLLDDEFAPRPSYPPRKIWQSGARAACLPSVQVKQARVVRPSLHDRHHQRSSASCRRRCACNAGRATWCRQRKLRLMR